MDRGGCAEREKSRVWRNVSLRERQGVWLYPQSAGIFPNQGGTAEFIRPWQIYAGDGFLFSAGRSSYGSKFRRGKSTGGRI